MREAVSEAIAMFRGSVLTSVELFSIEKHPFGGEIMIKLYNQAWKPDPHYLQAAMPACTNILATERVSLSVARHEIFPYRILKKS